MVLCEWFALDWPSKLSKKFAVWELPFFMRCLQIKSIEHTILNAVFFGGKMAVVEGNAYIFPRDADIIFE